jgi:hypothetical protein
MYKFRFDFYVVNIIDFKSLLLHEILHFLFQKEGFLII